MWTRKNYDRWIGAVAGVAVEGQVIGRTQVHGSASPTTNHISLHTPRHSAAKERDAVIKGRS